MEGAIVFDQRVLGAEPATAGTVAAIQIVTRTECHCACPKGSTTFQGRERPARSPRHHTAFITNLAPKERHRPITRLKRAYLTQCGPGRLQALVTFPIQSTSLMNFVSTQLPRGCVVSILHPSPFWNEFAFSQHKTRLFRVWHSEQCRSPFCHAQPLGLIGHTI